MSFITSLIGSLFRTAVSAIALFVLLGLALILVVINFLASIFS